MIDALRYEVVRLVTIRSTYWLIGLALLFQLVLSMIIAWQLPEFGPLSGGEEPFAALVTIGASTGFAPLLIAYILGLLGVFSMGHEYRHGMIRATLTALPRRGHVLVAKVVTTAVVSALAAVLCVVAGWLSAVVFSVGLPTAGQVLSITTGTVVYTVLFTLSGLAFALVLRNQTAAVAMLLLVPTVGESIIKGAVAVIKLSSDDPDGTGGVVSILKYLPYDAGGKMYTRLSLSKALEFLGYRPFDAVGGGIVLAVFVGLLLALGSFLFLRRDA